MCICIETTTIHNYDDPHRLVCFHIFLIERSPSFSLPAKLRRMLIACSCNMMGTLDNGGCDPYTGLCTCKRFVGGPNCDQCLVSTEYCAVIPLLLGTHANKHTPANQLGCKQWTEFLVSLSWLCLEHIVKQAHVLVSHTNPLVLKPAHRHFRLRNVNGSNSCEPTLRVSWLAHH